MEFNDLGLMGFAEALAIQERLVADVFNGSAPETVLLLEHLPVYTMGHGGSEANILDPSVNAVRINRGGDITYHGPGQLIGYPIVNLGRRGRDLHRYLRFLEELIIAVAGDFQVAACRVPGKTGVWTDSGKLASIGVGVRRWVTMHGFAMNVTTDLLGFSVINPCGIAACPVTSLERLTDQSVQMEKVKTAMRDHFLLLLDERLPVQE
jgi:lipoyl(octanoyl) transferase